MSSSKRPRAAATGGSSASRASAPAILLNSGYSSEAGVAAIKQRFRSGLPFPHVLLEDVFPDASLQRVRKELLAATYKHKRNDLYHFEQTDELKTCSGNATAELREYLYSPAFRAWITSVSGVPTNDTVDISAASYTDGSYLLCHDDDLAERRIAFIIYLVPETWEATDGGAFDMFSIQRGSNGTIPDRVVRTLQPKWNSIAFFEVSHMSHHQVAEVLCATKGPRLSISGWFHGPPLHRPPMAPLAPLPSFIPPPPPEEGAPSSFPVLSALSLPHGAGDALTDWINPAYLRRSVLAQMATAFQRDASLELSAFLKADVYEEVVRALGAQAWARRGPPNMQNYRACWDTGDLDLGDDRSAALARKPAGIYQADVVRRLFGFMTGWNFASFVRLIAGGEAVGAVDGEVRCFAHGDYTMLCDPDYLAARKEEKQSKVNGGGSSSSASSAGAAQQPEPSTPDAKQAAYVDVTLCCVREEEWGEEAGGYVSYLTATDELLTVPPKRNSLSLVQRDPEVMRFVKFVSHHAAESRYDVALSFRQE